MYPAGFTASSYCKGYSFMLWPWDGGSTTVPSAGAGGSHQQSETWRWSHLQWSSSALNQQERRSQKSTSMCTSCKGHLGSCPVVGRQRNFSSKRSWIPSRNAFSVSGFLHCQRRNQVSNLLAPLGTTPSPTTVSGTMPRMTDSRIWSEAPVKRP